MNRERFETLRGLKPVDAVRAWLTGAFGIGDEPALLEAIRRDSRITLSDREITETICDAMDEELDPSDCLERMAQRGAKA